MNILTISIEQILLNVEDWTIVIFEFKELTLSSTMSAYCSSLLKGKRENTTSLIKTSL
jgi:hypothetical protein